MTQAAVAEPVSESTSIAVIVQEQPVVVLLHAERRKEFYAHIQKEVDEFEADVSTAKGRDAIKSLAYKITRTKTAIDAAGKELNEEARAKINAVDVERRAARAHLDELQEKVRKPLTDWENAEKERLAKCEEILTDIRQSRNVFMEDTAEAVRARGHRVYEIELTEDLFGDQLEAAKAEKAETINSLKASLQRLEKEEADRAELERLRAEQEEREAKEAEERAEQERKAVEAEAARIEEERRKQAEEAEAQRIRDAEEKAKRDAQAEADRKAAEERAEQQRQYDAEIAAEREKAAEAERQAQAERDRAAEVERQRQAEADAQAAREADQSHRTKLKAAAQVAIVACGADDETALKIVLSILAGEIPNVRMEF